MEPHRIAHRIVMLNFNTAPPAGLTVANTLCDLFSAPDTEQIVSIPRAELLKVAEETGGHYWTKDAVSRIHLLDSTMRESMRLSDFGSLAFPRRVAAKEGIKMSGIHVPKGTWMQIPMHNIHIDEDNYTSAAEFRPFRFARPHAPATGVGEDDGSKSGPQKSLVTLDDTFLIFGYGRFGCPGRTFGAHLMKVMLAYTLENYDIEHLESRPPMQT
jgi:cytochrome P450